MILYWTATMIIKLILTMNSRTEADINKFIIFPQMTKFYNQTSYEPS